MADKAFEARVILDFFGDDKSIGMPTTLFEDRPSLLVELWGKRLCGVVQQVHDVMLGKRHTLMYTVLSDEIIDQEKSYTDKSNRRIYNITGDVDIWEGERIHAYVSRGQKAARPLYPSTETCARVMVHLMKWYDNLSVNIRPARTQKPALRIVEDGQDKKGGQDRVA